MLVGQDNRGFQLGNRVRVFAAHIDVAVPRTHRMGGNCHAFDQLKRIAFHQHPVGKGAAVTLIGVADHVLLVAARFHHGAPLDPGGEACAAAPAQAAFDHFGDHVGALHRPGAVQTGPAAGRLIVFKPERNCLAGAGKGQALLPADKGMIGDLANRFGAGASQDRRDIIQPGRAKAGAVDFHQRFQPMHAPA